MRILENSSLYPCNSAARAWVLGSTRFAQQILQDECTEREEAARGGSSNAVILGQQTSGTDCTPGGGLHGTPDEALHLAGLLLAKPEFMDFGVSWWFKKNK